jgi:hypothetical protein
MLNNDGMNCNTPSGTQRVGVILRRCSGGIREGWLARAKQSSDLSVVPLSDEQRAVHIPRLVEDLVFRLSRSSAAIKDSDAISSVAAVAHGKLRYLQGYSAAMLVDESRIMEVTVFGILQSNRKSLNFTLLMPDVMAIADEVDAQLAQSMAGYMELVEERRQEISTDHPIPGLREAPQPPLSSPGSTPDADRARRPPLGQPWRWSDYAPWRRKSPKHRPSLN